MESDGLSSSTAGDHLVITTALPGSSSTISASFFESGRLVRCLVDEAATSHAVAAKYEKAFDGHNRFVAIAEKLANNTLNKAVSLRRRVAAAGICEETLLHNASRAFHLTARCPLQLRRTHNTNSTHNKDLVKTG